MMNGFLKTTILLAGITALFMGVGYLLGGESGMLLALLVAGGMNLFAYWNSDKMVLRMHKARRVDASTAPNLVRLVEQLAQRADMPMPAVYIIDTDQPNAFATGRNPQNAAVAATSGLLRHLSDEEVAGVMAHELAHIKNRDTLIMTVTATLAGGISMLAQFAFFFGQGRNNPLGIVGVLLTVFLAPFAAMLVQMAISRAREYEADRVGAEICGKPEWLASALEKIGVLAGKIDNPIAEENPATAHLYISNPLHAKQIDSLFTTHPPLVKRIERLIGGAQSAVARRAGPWA